MTTKNGDKSAMPNQSFGPDGLPTHEHEFGLTKREMMAMHMMAAIVGGAVSNGSAQEGEDAAVIAKAAMIATDALLAELERTK